MTTKLKTAEQMERHFKGMANHYRIAILLLIDKESGITVEAITEHLKANFKTISQHTRYLMNAGLIKKQYQGRMVAHYLSPYGKHFVRFIKNFQRLGSKY
ncbi:MAG: winged helix-turn-helix domain-containing protein [Patescibacteria group bacterium]